MADTVIGKTYGLLTVLAEAERVGKNRRVLVRCSCEAATEKLVYFVHLCSGATTSCGCVRKAAKTTHGLRQHRLYLTWLGMLQRCENQNYPNYANYGGRGIEVCERWQTLANFIEDMYPTYTEGLTLDRKDNNLGYNPENCRWATITEQARNTRRNVNVTVRGKTQCLAAWCEELKLNYSLVRYRLSLGKTPEQALTG